MAAACNPAARDQWGNVVSGIDLGRRMESVQLFGLTTPLITTSSGAKMGKTAAGAVWLNQDMLSVYDYWQFWRNTEDGDVGRFLRLFTDLPLDEIARLEKLQGAELNEAKKILATEATAVLHGREAADAAAETARRDLRGRRDRRKACPPSPPNCRTAFSIWRWPAGLAVVELRSAQADRQQRPQAQRRDGQRSEADGGCVSAQQRRRAEALQRQEEARSGEAGLMRLRRRRLGAGRSAACTALRRRRC